ncbi:hypothetical protein [Aureimonas pseudogalii]
MNSYDGFGMRVWKVMFGGDNLFGRLKLYIFLSVYILVSGLTLAQIG